MKPCMIIRGAVPVDGREMKFRPQSSWPDHHWTSQILDPLVAREHYQIQYVEDEFVITISPEAKEEDPAFFEHLMTFAKENGLDHTECLTECSGCEGHDKCITEHKNGDKG